MKSHRTVGYLVVILLDASLKGWFSPLATQAWADAVPAPVPETRPGHRGPAQPAEATRPADGGADAPAAAAQASSTQPSGAADLYLRAARAIAALSPSSSNLVYPAYPPFGDEWDRLARASWAQNVTARRLAREARARDRAFWPDGKDYRYLGLLRELANNLTDAAIFQHLRGDDAAAVELSRDVLHLATLLQREPAGNDWVRPLVAAGVVNTAMYRLMIIASAVRLTAEPRDDRELPVESARLLIGELLVQDDAESRLKRIFGPRYADETDDPDVAVALASGRMVEQFRRCNAERTFAAMSLACQVFRFEKRRWPASLAELVPAYLPSVPADPWGDGAQTFGYVVIPAGLPDGADRPLVYSRCWSHDGLFYRVDEPEYGFYATDGSTRPSAQQKHGGQFRDIVSWIPRAAARVGPTTRPLR